MRLNKFLGDGILGDIFRQVGRPSYCHLQQERAILWRRHCARQLYALGRKMAVRINSIHREVAPLSADRGQREFYNLVASISRHINGIAALGIGLC